MDRLHTCYAPVRRSPPSPYCYFNVLPLDLHVLGLSLAFILSQDQTLRCKIIITLLRMSNLLSVLDGNFYFPWATLYIIRCSLVLHLLLQSFKDHFVVLSCCSTPRGLVFSKAAAKLLLLFGLTKFSVIFFSIFFVRGWFSMFVSITVFEVSCRTRLC